jgi:tagatose-6-phosphate ketose/aldose isomerase
MKTMLDSGLDARALDARGALATATEIAQQPAMLRATQALLDERAEEIGAWVAARLRQEGVRVVFAGAGTSAFIGECLAPELSRRLGVRCDAVATTDIVATPAAAFVRTQPLVLVSFARSGNSPESLATVELADRLVDRVHHLVVTCNADGALARHARGSRDALLLLLPDATHDRSFAMTSSFSCMLHAALAAFRGPEAARARLEAVAVATAEVIEREGARMRELAAAGHDRVVYLGSHVLRGLAREAALKLLELSDGRCVALHDTPLGFRHGPKTVVNERALVVLFVSNDPHTRKYDLDLLAELGRDRVASRVLAVTARPIAPIAGVDTVDVPHLSEADDVDLLVPYVALAQLLAFHASLQLGLSPDRPNVAGTVNRVVQGVTIHPLD